VFRVVSTNLYHNHTEDNNSHSNHHHHHHHDHSRTQEQTQCVCSAFINKQYKDIQQHRLICHFPFVCCQVCYFICNDRGQLLKHQISKHGYYGILDINRQKKNIDNLYICDFKGCNKSFFELKRLTEHYNRHYRPIACNKCNKSFARNWDLKIHLKTKHGLINDNDDQLQKCKFCDKRFASSKSLRNHIKLVHEKSNNPFLCRKCHKKFNRKSSLKNHYKTHKEDTERTHFKCKQCHTAFTFKYNLNKHIRKYHQT